MNLMELSGISSQNYYVDGYSGYVADVKYDGAYHAPSYSAPAYSAPAYSAPSYSAPAYKAPAYSRPAY